MKSSFIRTSVVTGLTAISAFAITACSPALENPSDEKVDTATSFSAPTSGADETLVVAAGTPSFIDCVSAPEQTPETVSLNCTDNSDTLVAIEWEEWGAQEATGTGTRETVDATSSEPTTEENTEIVLSAPFEGPQGLVFTEISVDGETVTP